MEAARKITSDAELRAIAAAGEGFIADPFNRWWHVATCPRIVGMTLGEPKWFASSRAALDAYLEQRRRQYATAKPILACKTCVAGAGARAGVHSVARSTTTPAATGDSLIRPPLTRRSRESFDVWADEYVRNESKAASTAGALRRLIACELRRLPEPAGRLLDARYAGQRSRGTDVENILFNNIDQTLSLFSRTGRFGIRFEDLGLVVPPSPEDAARQSFYSYGLVKPGDPFATVASDRLICRVAGAAVPDGPARLAARLWLAVARARTPQDDGDALYAGDFVLRFDLRGLHPAMTVKALVDGATAAMQRDDPERVIAAMSRLSALLDVDAEELLALATTPEAPLGKRSRVTPWSKESLFTLDGSAQVRVTPDDDRCIAAEIVAAGEGEAAELTVEVYAATPR